MKLFKPYKINFHYNNILIIKIELYKKYININYIIININY